MQTTTKARTLSRHIVADPKICHGKPTFRGTRVLVVDVLDQVAAGLAWETIIDEWNGSISTEAIREAIQLASQALLRHADDFFRGADLGMNILDENIPANQRRLLEYARVRVHQIGFNVGRRGMQDEEIIPFLLQKRRPTFFTRDEDFYDRKLCHRKYCLVYLAVEKNEAAAFARKLLRHPTSDTQAKRLGSVIRVSSAGLAVWRLHATEKVSLSWSDS